MSYFRPAFGTLTFLVAVSGCGSSGSSGNVADSSVSDSGAPDLGTDAPSTGALSVWTSGAGRKVQPTTSPGATASIALESYRDATISAQVVVRAKGGDLRGVKVATSDLSDGAGHALKAAELTLFREAFIDFTGVTAHGGNVPAPASSPSMDGKIPDALIPLVDPYAAGGSADVGQPFDVAPEQNQPLFLDVHVPKGTPAGTYTGTLHVTATGGFALDVPVSLSVLALDLPDMRSVTTHFKMGENDLLQYHHGLAACSGTDCWLDWNAQSRTVVKRYEELAHEHRIDVGQSFVTQPTDGCKVPTDWSTYDAALAPYMDGSYFKNGVPSSRLTVPFSPGEDYGLETCSQAEYTAMAKAWATHLKAKGWFDRAIVYAYDEPPTAQYPVIAKHSAWMQAGDPEWLAHVMDTVAPDPSNVATLNPGLGIYCVALAWYDVWNAHGPLYGRKEWPGLLAQGKKLWFYESNAQDPPYVTFASNTLDGLEPTIMMWGAWYERATGFLYWDIAAWDTKDPWGPAIGFNKTGDGVLLYPGNHDGMLAGKGSPAGVAIDGPIPSYRLKMVRQGLQDWALFALAERKGLGATVRTEVAKIYSQLGGCTYQGCPAPGGGFFWKSDEAAMAQIRKTVVEAILAKP
jgi:hypothetical protein